MSTQLSATSPESTWREEGSNRRGAIIPINPHNWFVDVTVSSGVGSYYGSVFPISLNHTPRESHITTESGMNSGNGLLGLPPLDLQAGAENRISDLFADVHGSELERPRQDFDDIPMISDVDDSLGESKTDPEDFGARSGSFGYPHFVSGGNGENRFFNETHQNPFIPPHQNNEAPTQDPTNMGLVAQRLEENSDGHESIVVEVIHFRDSQDKVMNALSRSENEEVSHFRYDLALNHHHSTPKTNHLNPSQMHTPVISSPTASPAFSGDVVVGRRESPNSKQTSEADDHNLSQMHTPVNGLQIAFPAFSNNHHDKSRLNSKQTVEASEREVKERPARDLVSDRIFEKKESVKTECCCVIQ